MKGQLKAESADYARDQAAVHSRHTLSLPTIGGAFKVSEARFGGLWKKKGPRNETCPQPESGC